MVDWGIIIAGLNGLNVLTIVAVAAVSYFLGCFNGAVIVSKYILRDDVRTHGSGNAGLTNFYRTFGGPLTFVVILCDVLKAVIAVLIGTAVFQHIAVGAYGAELAAATSLTVLGKFFAGLFCLVGHMFPIMFGFKGGKGILSGGTIAIMIDWRLALVCWGCFLILAALTKWVSLGSIAAGAAFPVMTWLIYGDWLIFLLGLAIGGLIVWKHRGNLQRLLKGEESKFSFHRKKE